MKKNLSFFSVYPTGISHATTPIPFGLVAENKTREEAEKQQGGLTMCNRSCHHCYTAKLICDGQRPCKHCVASADSRICFDHQSTSDIGGGRACHHHHHHQHTSKINKRRTTCKSTPTPITTASALEERRRDLLTAQNHLLQLEDRITSLEQQNASLIKILNNDLLPSERIHILSQQPKSVQRALWKPPVNINKPVVVVDLSTMRVIGCNRAVCNTTGYGPDTLQKNFSIFDLKPQRFRSFWNMFYRFLSHSQVKTVISPVYLENKDGTEKKVKRITHFENGFFWTEWDETGEVSSDIQIDGNSIPHLYNLYLECVREEGANEALKKAENFLSSWLTKHIEEERDRIYKQLISNSETFIIDSLASSKVGTSASPSSVKFEEEAAVEQN